MTSKAKTRRPGIVHRLTQQLQDGRVEWIGLRTERKGPVRGVQQANALAEQGLEGDRRIQGRPGSSRQITFISQEHLCAVASILGKTAIDPALVRRNVVISGVNINALKHKRFQIGDAVFEPTAYCHPCSRMEENLGTNGFSAMMGHGGLCAKILQSGQISIGDPVVVINE